MRRSLALLALLSSCVAPLAAHADTFSFTFSTIATGTVGSTTFTDAPFVVTGTYDTTEITPVTTSVGSGFDAPTLFTYTIDGITYNSTAGDLDDILAFPDQGVVEILSLSQTRGFFIQPFNTGTDLSSAVTLEDVRASWNANSLDNVGTGSDLLTLTVPGAQIASTLVIQPVSAGGGSTVTPEPSSLMLLSTGLVGVAGAVRRRLRRA
jgi:hypothetical protein